MSKSPLFLSSDGLYHLSHQQQEKTLKANWKLSSSLCLVFRECYWEHIAYYPTSNISEVYKIISAEINSISPLPGETKAFIISLSKNRATVLYCCFSPEVLAQAERYKLWRLIPETLPLYRSLPDQPKTYITRASCIPLNITDESKSGKQQSISLQTVLKIEDRKLASLPHNGHTKLPLCAATLSEASAIDEQQYAGILGKFRPLDALDFTLQSIEHAKDSFTNKKHLGTSIAILCISALLTFVLGKSALVLWQQESLSSEISSLKSDAAKSIQLLNSYKQTERDVESINQNLDQHLPKSTILGLLRALPTEENKLKFKTINISPVAIQLQGTIQSSATLLADLSNIKGFNEVKFINPPAAIKNIGERFNINISYDPNIYSSGVKL